jgi:hypothetical protein
MAFTEPTAGVMCGGTEMVDKCNIHVDQYLPSESQCAAMLLAKQFFVSICNYKVQHFLSHVSAEHVNMNTVNNM